MTVLTLIFLAIFILIVAVFAVFSIALFYHIDRFSFYGDFSKGVYVIFTAICSLIILTSFVLIIINHLSI